MTEITLNIDSVDPIEFLGVNNTRFAHIKRVFPTIRMVSRGHLIKAEGREEELELFRKKIEQMIDHLHKNGKLTDDIIDTIAIGDGGNGVVKVQEQTHVIVYGNKGHVVRARTENQRLMVKESETNDILFAIGPAGTGKTYTAVALAVRALKEKNVRRIILTRPAVEAGESLGFLPGDMKEKIDPYLRPLYDALNDMIPSEKMQAHLADNTIEIAPLAFMRGRTLDNSFILLDEAQNASSPQLKMFLTRIGPSSKCIVTGDPTQIDLPKPLTSGLDTALRILKGIDGIATIRLNEEDVVRHRLVKEIIRAYDTLNN